MSDVSVQVQATRLEWHSVEEIPPLHTVEYAGEVWLQSKPLLLVNAAGKIAVGYCRQEAGGQAEFEAGVGSQRLSDISIWAIVELPNQNGRGSAQNFVPKITQSRRETPG
jgi:hypothetical protein